jgi:hypothetical protein
MLYTVYKKTNLLKRLPINITPYLLLRSYVLLINGVNIKNIKIKSTIIKKFISRDFSLKVIYLPAIIINKKVMTEKNTHLDPNHIQDLEKKYMEKIWENINSENFNYTLENVSKKINENLDDWKIKFDMKNFFNIPFERICKYYLSKVLSSQPWASPISSDLAFYTNDNDCILCIDAKTINSKKGSNEGDVDDLIVSPNQVAIESNAREEDYNIGDSGYSFAGIRFQGKIPSFDKDFEQGKKLPVLTYTIKCIYYSDLDNNIFYLKKLFLTNIPNPIVYEKNWPNEKKIDNLKTYRYITDFPDYKTSSAYKRILSTEFDKSDKIKFVRKIGKKKNKTFYLDKNLKNPFPELEKFNLAWTDVSRKGKRTGFEIPITAGTGRLIIRPDRKDSKGNEWKGLLEKYLSSTS